MSKRGFKVRRPWQADDLPRPDHVSYARYCVYLRAVIEAIGLSVTEQEIRHQLAKHPEVMDLADEALFIQSAEHDAIQIMSDRGDLGGES